MIKVFLIIISILHLIHAETPRSLNFGIASVVLKQDANNIFELTEILNKKSGINITPKFAKDYDEIKQMLEKGEVDFAYICGATFVEARKSADLEILALPYSKNEPFYYSLVITAKNSSAKSLLDFRNKLYAFADPKSNSGSIVPKYELKKHGFDYKYFFKDLIYTFDHSDSIDAVFDGFVDGASVDSLVYESYRLLKPQRAEQIKVISRFGPFQTTPVVIKKSVDAKSKALLLSAFKELGEDTKGKKILESFGSEKFDLPNEVDYSKIEEMMNFLELKNKNE